MTAALTDPDRLRVLAQTELMDAGSQESFDRLTRVATRVLGVPVALVSLVDGERQYLVGEVGLGLRETPLTHSFCQHVVVDETALVISDARLDPRVSESLAVSELAVIAYAGVPLRTAGGQTLGSLCAIDSVPRDWSAEDLELLGELARSVITEIEVRAANRWLLALQAQLTHTQRLARVGSWAWDPREDSGVWSAEMFRIFGRDPQLGSPSSEQFMRYAVREDRPGLAEAYAAMLAGDSSLELEYRICTDAGNERVLHALAAADRDRPGWYAGTLQDVTERRTAELAAQRARDHAEAITAAMAEGYVLTVDGHIVPSTTRCV